MSVSATCCELVERAAPAGLSRSIPLAAIAIGQAAVRAFDAASGSARPAVIARLPRRRGLACIDTAPWLLKEPPHPALAAPSPQCEGQWRDARRLWRPPRKAASPFPVLGIDDPAFAPARAKPHFLPVAFMMFSFDNEALLRNLPAGRRLLRANSAP